MVQERDEEIERWKTRVSELETLLKRQAEELEKARQSISAKPVQKDDLQRIYGVGPVLARMLNRLGINTFREIASWTEEDIDRIDAKLEHFRGRIRRENWVASAKEEHFKKYGERL
jgi:predicted flap endonuclease-1-like 5' DNA nuclease